MSTIDISWDALPSAQQDAGDPSAGLVGWAERGWLPDALIRAGIRRRCAQRQAKLLAADAEARAELLARFVAELDAEPVAPLPERANDQHYELPPAFFEQVLGPHRKYSSCYWAPGTTTLGEAEAAALAATCERAELADGQRILELGCGWGSLSLWIAEHYPGAQLTAVSNSAPQRAHIEAQAEARGLTNLRVVTADMNHFDATQLPGGAAFDRVVSVEMFEHMRNYRELLRRVRSWLVPGGALFVHIFVHKETPYAFHEGGDDNWMGAYFFTGGQMPSHDLLLHFQDDLKLERRWVWDGTHYQRTAEAWLENMDRRKAEVMPILREVYGDQAVPWFGRWRMFFLACAELFGFERGQRWWVSHYRFRAPE